MTEHGKEWELRISLRTIELCLSWLDLASEEHAELQREIEDLRGEVKKLGATPALESHRFDQTALNAGRRAV